MDKTRKRSGQDIQIFTLHSQGKAYMAFALTEFLGFWEY